MAVDYEGAVSSVDTKVDGGGDRKPGRLKRLAIQVGVCATALGLTFALGYAHGVGSENSKHAKAQSEASAELDDTYNGLLGRASDIREQLRMRTGNDDLQDGAYGAEARLADNARRLGEQGGAAAIFDAATRYKVDVSDGLALALLQQGDQDTADVVKAIDDISVAAEEQRASEFIPQTDTNGVKSAILDSIAPKLDFGAVGALAAGGLDSNLPASDGYHYGLSGSMSSERAQQEIDAIRDAVEAAEDAVDSPSKSVGLALGRLDLTDVLSCATSMADAPEAEAAILEYENANPDGEMTTFPSSCGD